MNIACITRQSCYKNNIDHSAIDAVAFSVHQPRNNTDNEQQEQLNRSLYYPICLQ